MGLYPGLIGIFLGVITLLLPSQGVAQIRPNTIEIAAYTGVHKAAHEGDIEQLNALIAASADLEARDGKMRTALHVAAFASQVAAVRTLAAAGADANALEHQAYDMITIAAVANDLEMLKVAIEVGNNPSNVTSPYDGTALIAAAHLGHVEIVQHLLEAGAPVDHINNLGWTALIEAVILGDGGENHQKCVKALLQAGADPTIRDANGATPLEHAVSRNFTEIISMLKGD